ncbi:MAG: general secretion pathway protein GspB [Nitrospirota bacterium]
MSYILDALKKSEKEKIRGTVPDVLTVQEPVSHDRQRRNILLSLVALALITNAAILIWWLVFAPGEKKVPGTPDAAHEVAPQAQRTTPGDIALSQNNPVTSGGDVIKALPGATQPAVNGVHSEVKRQQVLSERDKTEQPHSTGETDRTYTVTNPQRKDADSRLSQSREETPVPDPEKIYALNELPEKIRKELPPLSLTIALYSNDPSTRIARIDGQSLREGQDLAPGLRLEQIIEHGAVLSYRNYRFRVGMK